MGRIGDALFNGIVSGSARGMSSYLETASDSKKKVKSVANEHLANSSGERPPVKTWPDGQDRHVVGSRKPGSSTSAISQSTQTPTLVKGAVSPENSSKEDTHVPEETKPEESPKDSLTQIQSNHPQSIAQTDFYSKETPLSFTVQSHSISYTHDQMKSSLKAVFIEARKEARLDGSFGKDKVSLNEIVTFAANRFTYPQGLTKSERKKYNHVADVTLKKLEDYIKRIAPQVDAKTAAKIIILRSCDAEKSSACVGRAAEAAMNFIHKQTQKPQESSVVCGQLIGSPPGTEPVQQKRRFEHLNSQGKVIQSSAHFSSVSPSNPQTNYLIGITQIVAGGALMLFGGAIELGSGGLLTIGFVVAESTGFALITQGLSRTTTSAQNISFDKYSNSPWGSTDPFSPSHMSKKGSVDPSLPKNPDDLLKRPGWEETTHPEAGKRGHRAFENKQTGEQYRHDQGRPGEPGHEANNHWHHLRPDGKGGFEYLDGNKNPVPKGHDKAHIYPGG